MRNAAGFRKGRNVSARKQETQTPYVNIATPRVREAAGGRLPHVGCLVTGRV